VTVLDDYCDTEIGIHAVFPSASRHMPAKTRACVEWLARELPLRLSTGAGPR
jgi:hypothetical protein